MTSRIRKYLSFSNVVAVMALFIALGGSAYAVGKNTIGTSQIKNNAVTAKKIKKNAVVAAKIKNGAVSGAKLGSVPGDKVNVSSLGKVPSAVQADSATTANTATTAASLEGQVEFFVKLQGGQSREIARYGQVGLTATCLENESGNDVIQITAFTTVDGAVLAGNSYKSGGPNPNNFLNVDTPDYERDFEGVSDSTGETLVEARVDSGFVMGPDGKTIVANTEGWALGLNYLDSRCIAAGIVNYIG